MSLLASALLAAAPVSAGPSYSGIFEEPGSGGNSGSYYLVGQEASQSFLATGLTEVNSLQLTLRLADPDFSSNQLAQPLTFSFQLIGTTIGTTVTVGTTVYGPFSAGKTEWEPRDLDFDFAPLFDARGDWTLRIVVSQAGDPCCAPGNIRLSSNNPFEISIPEPNGLALVALGLVGAGLFCRRR